MEQAPSPETPTRKKRLLYAAAALLLAVHLILVVQFCRSTSGTFDEIVHVTGGYTYLTTRDCRFMDVVTLPDRLAALPLLFMDLRFPGPQATAWIQGNPIETAQSFFFRMGNDPAAMLFASRLAMALVCLFPGIVIFFWSRSLFGDWAGLLSLAVFCFAPLMLAHNGLAASDTFTAGLLLLCAGLLWRLFHRAGLFSLLASGLCLGLLAVTKVSGAMILPMGLLMLLVRVAVGRPWTLKLRKEREVKGRLGQAGLALALALALIVMVWAFIWAFYGFRYSAFAPSENKGDGVRVLWQEELSQEGAAREAISYAWDHRLLPEAYLWMYAYVMRNSQQRRAFAMGRFSVKGWPWFFPFCFAVKTPLSLMALILLSLGIISAGRTRASLYRLTPLAALFFVYWAVALGSHLNIGQRHLMPAYMVLYVLAGAGGGLTGRGSRASAGLSWGLAALLAAASLSVYPHFLGFFNAAAGGPNKGYRLLVDSSLDWGQDLPALAKRLDKRDGNEPVYLSYFGTASPAAYGVSARPLPSYEPLAEPGEEVPEPLFPGTYAISATQLWQVYMKPMGYWCEPYEKAYGQTLALVKALRESAADPQMREALYQKAGGRLTVQSNLKLYRELRAARLFAALRQREPDDRAGFSILIYRVGPEELEKALFGPPAELLPSSGVAGAGKRR